MLPAWHAFLAFVRVWTYFDKNTTAARALWKATTVAPTQKLEVYLDPNSMYNNGFLRCFWWFWAFLFTYFWGPGRTTATPNAFKSMQRHRHWQASGDKEHEFPWLALPRS